MRCTAAMIVSLALGALLCAEAYGQNLPFDPNAARAVPGLSEELRKSAPGIRKLIARKLAGEDVCSETLDERERRVVCTPEGVFKWADPDFDPSQGCGRCARYMNSFAYEMCAQGRIKRGPGSIMLDPC